MEIQITNEELEDILMCPQCEQELPVSYLHHDRVEVYDRGEDAQQVRRTLVDGQSVLTEVVSSSDSANPSVRRHGLRIRFSCENCPNNLWLNFSQHKGQTFVHWTVDSK